jgi:hypothetical protein
MFYLSGNCRSASIQTTIAKKTGARQSNAMDLPPQKWNPFAPNP